MILTNNSIYTTHWKYSKVENDEIFRLLEIQFDAETGKSYFSLLNYLPKLRNI
uniref:Uncharacterized protein n=1 Tax=Onchocerca volvulus TaxID=6282 RepID=A0A8R1XWM5_ONCVO